MDYGMIGKIEKAKRYAEERHRFRFNSLNLAFIGDNNSHVLELADGKLKCDCEFFLTHDRCGHTMALEILFREMLPSPVDA
jgi:hypothetical protein